MEQIMHKLEKAFDHHQAAVLAEVIADSYHQLVKVSDFSELKEIVAELAQAQQRTEVQVVALAQAQQKTWIAVEKLHKQVGGLSERVGGDIEIIGATVTHEVLRREYGWKMGPLEQGYVKVNGHEVEIDFTGTAQDPSQPHRIIRIIGEAKQNLTKREVEKFLRKVEKIRPLFPEELYPVVFSYRSHPEAIQLIEQAGLTRISARGEIEREAG